MNRIKSLREKYSKKRKLSQRKLGLLIGYSRDQIYRRESGKCKLTNQFKTELIELEKILEYGDIKIPK